MRCHKTGLGAQCAHPEPRSRAHCACSAHVMGTAARTASMSRSCRAHSQRRSRAQRAQVAAHSSQVVGACRDLLPLPSPSPSRDIISRSRPPGRLSQVATSIPHRDLPSAQKKTTQVATSKWGRDTSFHRPARTMSQHQSVSRHHSGQSRSRHQNQVATLLEDTLCRDINFMTRHRFCPQWAFQVVTPKIHVATSHIATHVAISYPCRDVVSAQPKQTRSRLHFWSRPHADLTRSRPQSHVATSHRFPQVTT